MDFLTVETPEPRFVCGAGKLKRWVGRPGEAGLGLGGGSKGLALIRGKAKASEGLHIPKEGFASYTDQPGWESWFARRLV